MASRSYLYIVDHLPEESGPQPRISGVMEWNWDVPLAHRLLVSGNTQECPSLIWTAPLETGEDGVEWPAPKAIAGEARLGVANLERAFAQLPQTPEVQQNIEKARVALAGALQRGSYFVLEHAEITFELMGSPSLAEGAYLEVLGDAQSPESLIDYVRDQGLEVADEVTGSNGFWSPNLYFAPAGSTDLEERAVAEAAPAQPAQPPHVPQKYSQPYPPGYQPLPDYGRTSWALGFLAWIPVPVFPLLIAGIAMLVSGTSAKRIDPIAQQNGRNAANWGATLALLTVFLIGAQILMTNLMIQSGSKEFFPGGIPLVLIFVLALVHTVVTIAGTVKSKRGRVFLAPAIPFFKRRV